MNKWYNKLLLVLRSQLLIHSNSTFDKQVWSTPSSFQVPPKGIYASQHLQSVLNIYARFVCFACRGSHLIRFALERSHVRHVWIGVKKLHISILWDHKRSSSSKMVEVVVGEGEFGVTWQCPLWHHWRGKTKGEVNVWIRWGERGGTQMRVFLKYGFWKNH